MSKSRSPLMSRRDLLATAAAGAFALGGGRVAARAGLATAQSVLSSENLEVLVVSDGHFVLPTGFLVAPEAPASEREAVLEAAGQGEDQIQLTNNVAVIRSGADVILVDAGCSASSDGVRAGSSARPPAMNSAPGCAAAPCSRGRVRSNAVSPGRISRENGTMSRSRTASVARPAIG